MFRSTLLLPSPGRTENLSHGVLPQGREFNLRPFEHEADVLSITLCSKYMKAAFIRG